MNIVNITLGVDTQPCSSITLGRRGENEVTQVVVDFSSWVEEFGAGVITLLAMRSQDTSAYPVVLTLDGNTATWDVTSTDTAYKGSGRAEYIYTVGEQIAKSVLFNTVVLQDIGEPSETPPDPYEEWLERLTELGAETQANAQAAQQSAEDAEQSAREAAQEAANAEGYAEQAGESASAAQTAEADSEAARDAAQTAQASAEASATAASGSAASAAGSATAAAGSASDASSSASAAGASATTASTAAGQAEAAKTAAQNAQSAAEDAAEDAQQAAQQAHVEYEQLSGEVDDLSDEVSQQKSAIDDLTALVDRKAGMLVDTASGAIASFVPDSTIPDLLGVTVDIEPVQDLHGQDAPYPPGGGKNKLKNEAVTTTHSGITFTVNADGTVLVNGTATENVELTLTRNAITDAGDYIVSGCPSGGSVNTYWVNIRTTSNGSVSWRQEYGAGLSINNCTVENFGVYVKAGATVNNVVFRPMIRLATETDATFAPYENICPISGWDAVGIDSTGVNLWDEEYLLGFYSTAGNFVSNTSGYFSSKNKISVKPLTEYAFCIQSASGTFYICHYDASGGFIRRITYSMQGGFRLLPIPEDTYFINFSTEAFYGTTYNHDISINYPATDHAYRPYAGNRYTITLGDTVYGAKLTIAEDGSVNALVDRARVDLGTLNWRYQAASSVFYSDVPGKKADKPVICSIYKPSDSYGFNALDYEIATGRANNYVYIKDPRYTDAASFKTAVSGQTLVYMLDTPITIQLDPVTISVISGQTNNVWADAGDVSVEFAADVKNYIDQKIAAAVAAMS